MQYFPEIDPGDVLNEDTEKILKMFAENSCEEAKVEEGKSSAQIEEAKGQSGKKRLSLQMKVASNRSSMSKLSKSQ